MNPPESHLRQLQQHAREGEERIERQREIIQELERDGHVGALPAARQLLQNLENALRVTLELLETERRLSPRPQEKADSP